MTPDSHVPNRSDDTAERDALSLELMARRYGRALARYFERRSRRGVDVSDLVQDVFLRLARRSQLSNIEKPENYLFSAASSVLKDHARRDQARQLDAHASFDEAVHRGADFSAHRVLEGRQALACLEEALRGLPPRSRDVFVLRAFEERKMADVAQVLGISVRTAEKHYAKALVHAAKALEDWRD